MVSLLGILILISSRIESSDDTFLCLDFLFFEFCLDLLDALDGILSHDSVGDNVGILVVGGFVGLVVGCFVGRFVGLKVGCREGLYVGDDEGDEDGFIVGDKVGDADVGD